MILNVLCLLQLEDKGNWESSYNLEWKVKNSALSHPQDTHPVNLVPLWALPLPYPGPCYSIWSRNDTAKLPVWEVGELFIIACALNSFIFKLDMRMSIFLNIFVQDCR